MLHNLEEIAGSTPHRQLLATFYYSLPSMNYLSAKRVYVMFFVKFSSPCLCMISIKLIKLDQSINLAHENKTSKESNGTTKYEEGKRNQPHVPKIEHG